MSNAGTAEKNAVDALLESARKNILKYGYEKAALRQICADAGVTTGALYFSFKNKEALFDALVRPTMENLDRVVNMLNTRLVDEKGKNFNEEAFDEFIFGFLIENREGIRLLMTRASGSRYEGFHRKLKEVVEALMSHYAQEVVGVDVDPDVVSILTEMFFCGIEELIARDYDLPRMESIAGGLRACMEQGFRAMLEQQKSQG